MRFLCGLFIFWLIFWLVSSPAHAFQNFNFIRDQWQLQATQQGYFTTTNYDDGGNRIDLLPSHNYKHFLFQLDASYNWTEEFSFLASAGLASAQSSDSIEQRSNTAGTDVGVGMQYLWHASWIWIGPEIFYSYPLSTFSQTTDLALVNEGTQQLTGKINALKVWTRLLQSYGSIGYTYQSDGRASLIPWNFGSRLRLKRPWIGFELAGYRTALLDGSPETYRQTVTDRVDGGSLRFYSASPTLTELTGFVEIPFSKALVVRVAGGTSVAGLDTAQGFLYQLNLNYSFGGDEKSADYFHISNQYRKTKEREDKRLKKFHIQPDDEDPTLFNEE
jgi:hypothetical protein